MAALVGYISVKASLAQALVKQDPALAQALDPLNGDAAARLSWHLYSRPNVTDDNRTRARRLAINALRLDPTAVPALVTLGSDAQNRGDVRGATRFFTYSNKLSRRNLATKVWAIERASRKGDVADALRHFDTALRTSPAASDALFPVFATALAEPAIRAEMVRTLLRRPNWGDSFIAFVSLNSVDPRSARDLFADLQRQGLQLPKGVQADLVNSLIARQFVADAWNVYASSRSRLARQSLRNPSFETGPANPTLFDWTPNNDGTIGALIERGAFVFDVPATMSGVMLSQLQLFSPGHYRLSGRSMDLAQEPAHLPYWTLTCNNGVEVARVTVTNSAESQGRFNGEFNVPDNCRVQTLALVARASNAISGVSGRINEVQVVKLKNGSGASNAN